MIETQGVPEFVGSQQSSLVAGAIELAVEQDCGADDCAVAARFSAPKPDRLRQLAQALITSDDNLLRPHDADAGTRGSRLVLDGCEVLERVVGQQAKGNGQIGHEALRVLRAHQLGGGHVIGRVTSVVFHDGREQHQVRH